MAFAKVSTPISPEDDFWAKNPWLKIYPPYNNLLEEYGYDKSNKLMIAVFLMSDPDEDINPFFRMSEEQKKEVIKSTYVKDVDWSCPILKECLESWPFDCMDSIQRAFKEEKETLKARAVFLRDTPISLDETLIEIDDKGRKYAVNVKGTLSQLESARKNTLNIYKQYEQVEEKFISNKTSAIVRGGRRMTRAEKGHL
jgi:hypothetical protein